MVCRHRYALGKALRKVRRWKEARPVLDQAVTACAEAKHELAPWARYLAFKAAERLGDEEVSAEHNRALMASFPDHRLADDSGYYLIRHLLEDKKDLVAAETLIKKLVKKYPKGDMMTDAVFWVAIHAFSEKKYDMALRSWLWMLHSIPVLLTMAKWAEPTIGRLDVMRKWAVRRRHSVCIKSLSEYPLSWYSVLSYSRLREMSRAKADRWAKAAFKFRPRDKLKFLKTSQPKSTRWQHARALARLGLTQPAMQLLRGIRSDDESVQWQIAQLLDEAGAYHLSHNVLRRKLEHFRTHKPSGKNQRAWQVAYPIPIRKTHANES